MRKSILYTGGTLNLVLVALHVSFWRMLNWGTELPLLSQMNQAVVQTLNVCAILVILFFAVISFIIARRGVTDLNARAILLLVAAFYTTRLVMGWLLFGYSIPELVIWIVCAGFAAGYGYLAIRRNA